MTSIAIVLIALSSIILTSSSQRRSGRITAAAQRTLIAIFGVAFVIVVFLVILNRD